MKETNVLRILDLSRNRIADFGTNECRTLTYSLQKFNLSSNKLHKIEELSFLLRNFPTIIKLDLSHNLFKRFAVDWQFVNASLEYLVSKNNIEKKYKVKLVYNLQIF